MVSSTGILPTTYNLSPSDMSDYSAPPSPESASNSTSDRVDAAQAAINNVASVAATPGWERATLEKLALAALVEQRAARRWRNAIRIAWLVFLSVVLWFGLQQGGSTTDVSAPHTAVVSIQGEIAAGAEASAEFVVAAMRSAFEDDGAKAVVLLINSPGGSPPQARIINDEIKRLKALHNKPVTPWWKKPVPRPRTTLLRVLTRFLWTRPALWAALAC